MKIKLPARLRLLLATLLICCSATATYASHIFAIDLLYNYVSGSTYKVTLVVYGDCSSATAADLPTSTPTVYVYEGSILSQTLTLQIQAPDNGVLVSPVCPADTNSTTCNNINSTIPGIKKFVYTANATINGNSTHWRFLFTGAMGNSSAGRSQSITNVLNPGSSIIQLVDTMNNMNGPDSSATLTSLPVPFFCDNLPANYNPGAVSSDSLAFFLVPAVDASTGSNVTYVGGATATHPLYTSAFLFNNSDGQLSFTPDVLQKSLLVYNVEEFSGGVEVGTCQREMSFVVLNCDDQPPTGGIDTASLDTSITTLYDSTDIGVCQSVGDFTFQVNPTSPSGSGVTVSAAGLPSGATFTVTNNGSATPQGTFDWNTLTAIPGVYTFYLTFQDNACPLSSKQIEALTITLSPRPQISCAINSEPTCFSKGQFTITPSGEGSPWTIKVVQNSDTLQTIPNVTAPIIDSLSPGTYDILLSATTGAGRCIVDTIITLDTPHIPPPTVTGIAQTTCAPNGSITLQGLSAGSSETVNYEYNGIPGQSVTQTVSVLGTITIGGLDSGTYSNITITLGNCISDTANPVVLGPPPPIVISGDSVVNPTACGLYDGSITLLGLPANEIDQVSYNFNGTAQQPLTAVSGPDGSVLIGGLTAGTYDNISVLANDTCPSNVVGPIVLTAPAIVANYTYTVHYGCHADTVVFTNTSQFNGTVYYQWKFGDGSIDTNANPTHVFLTQDSFQVGLYVTNLYCVDSNVQTIQLIHPILPSFTLSADTICQGQSITFYNTSIGTQPVYFWNFGDGFASITDTPTHTFNIAGVYQVQLAENDFVPCFDTATVTVFVDSISALDFSISDTTLCQGKAITFTGNYSDIGNIGNVWLFGDGTSMTNTNPVQHSYDTTGQMTVTLTALYRKCPDTTLSKTVTIKPYPLLNLGPDTAVCPNMPPIAINDLINANNPLAKWLWSTGDTASGILVATPGTYYATVTINGCSTSDSVWVKNDCYINLPNAFTPNGDGVNDYFFPRQLLTNGVTSFSMNIYDRWGEQIFTTTSTDGRGWDGKFNNVDEPEGVYIYIIDISFKNGQNQHYQGNVTLLR
jgi:gliding motility-associated-like protein